MTDHNTLVLGAASWNRMVYVDSLPQGVSATIFDARETEAAGSTGVGKSFVLAALDCDPTFHCTLGRDIFAEQIKTCCAARGISIVVDEQDGPTPQHLNITDQAGGRYSILLSNGPDHPDLDEARIANHIKAANTIFLSLSHSSKKLLPLLNDCKAEVLLDLHDYDGKNPWHDAFIAHADVIQISDVALADPAPLIDSFLRGRAHQVVVTKGEAGAEIFTETEHVTIPPCRAKMVDSNGAGDAFSVALWYGQRMSLSLPEAGAFASATAAFAIEAETLFPPDADESRIRERAGLS